LPECLSGKLSKEIVGDLLKLVFFALNAMLTNWEDSRVGDFLLTTGGKWFLLKLLESFQRAVELALPLSSNWDDGSAPGVFLSEIT